LNHFCEILMSTVIALLALCAVSVYSWGNVGHTIVGSIAQQYLSTTAQSMVSQLISGDLSTVATWADNVKHTSAYAWSAGLHYIDTPDWECGFTPSTDCVGGECVSGAIANYTKRLETSDKDGQIEALKFLVHFVGDIHQPLHVGFTTDKGGNTYSGSFLQYSDKNLHAIWDEYIIYEKMDTEYSRSEADYLTYLLGRASGDLATFVQTWDAYALHAENKWAVESAKSACKYAYTDENGDAIADGFKLGDGYYKFVINEVEQDLVKGGIRLAALLNYVAEKTYYVDLNSNVASM
jgi:hypothetical protein